MSENDSVEQSIAHHLSHRNLSDKCKSSACNVSLLSAENDFAASLYGISAGNGHHSHDQLNSSSALSASHRLSMGSTEQYHSGESCIRFTASIHSINISSIDAINE